VTTNRYPNLFIAGAPKCGTTSLADYLGQHPDIFTAMTKEPVYFGSDLTSASRLPTSDYLDLYRSWKDERYAIDASTHYFFSSRAAAEIKAAAPAAEIVIMVRNPVEAVYSMYFQLRFNGAEPLESFEASVAAEERRAREKRPMKFGFPENLLYRDVFAFSRNIERFERVFGADHVHVLLLDDLKTDPLGEVKRLCGLLGLDPAPAEGFTFGTKNAAKRPRTRWANTLANYPPAWLRTFTAPFPKSLRIALRNRLARLNTAPATNPPINPDARAQLVRDFAGEVRWLSEYLDRDLSHWLSND
jgi:hypothetical protein